MQYGTILHAGCGHTPLPKWVIGTEVRLDIDPGTNPDIVASLTDLGDIGPFDSVFCSHTIEHLYPKDVPIALGEFHRVLKPCGMLLALVPDLEDIKPTEDVVYESSLGPVCGIDMYYGHRGLQENNPFMAHHTGFVKETFYKALASVGFREVRVSRVEVCNLIGIAIK